MKDFPVFTTPYGVASLVLREIPYQGTAYIVLQDSLEPEKLLAECVSFCKAAGAERVYAAGNACLEAYPFHTEMWELRAAAASIPDTDAALWPVLPENLEHWREIYNRKVRKVPNGAWMTLDDGKQMLAKGDGYFIHRGETLLGIGRASGGQIDWVASLQPGAGRDVVCALAHVLTEDAAELTAASVNEKAIRLYRDLGFLPSRVLSRWYRVF